MGDLVQVEAKKGIGDKRRLCDLHESCRATRHEVLESVSEAVGLAVKLVHVAVVIASPGAGSVSGPRIDELTGQLASTRAEAISLTAKFFDL